MSFLRQSVQLLCQIVKRRFRQWTKPNNHTLILNTALDLTRSKSELVLENALLRQQLIVLERQTKRPKLTWRDRALFVLWASKLRTWRQALVIVQPDTVLRWHRDLFRRVWKHKSKSKRKQGRPPLIDDIVALIKRIVKENLTWGVERIRGELECLDLILILSERHLYRVVKEYMAYFNRARPHQGIEQGIPCRPERLETPPVNGKLSSRPVLSGLHHGYYWLAEECVGQGRGQPQAYYH